MIDYKISSCLNNKSRSQNLVSAAIDISTPQFHNVCFNISLTFVVVFLIRRCPTQGYQDLLKEYCGSCQSGTAIKVQSGVSFKLWGVFLFERGTIRIDPLRVLDIVINLCFICKSPLTGLFVNNLKGKFVFRQLKHDVYIGIIRNETRGKCFVLLTIRNRLLKSKMGSSKVHKIVVFYSTASIEGYTHFYI